MQTLNDARELVDKICEEFEYEPYIILQWNDRYRTRFGTAHLRSKTISISSVLWNIASIEERIQVIYHEVAHIIAYDRYGDRGHGWQWKMVMRKMGRKPDRCHNITTTRQRRKSTIVVDCVGCSYKLQLGAKVQQKIRMGSVYRCKGCKTKITLV